MKTFIALAAIVVVASAYKENMLKQNKTPKGAFASASLTTTCDECKTLISRFAEAVKDPVKLAELKTILGMLCHETSYVEECKVFVSKLDYFIARLVPYLNNTEKVCKHFHLCANIKIDQFHRIGLLYAKKYMNRIDGANGLICEECQFAVGELKNLVEEKTSQEEVKHFISEEICRRLGRYQGSCDLMVEEFLPELFEELDKMLQNTKAFCSDLGFCKAGTLMSDHESMSQSIEQANKRKMGSLRLRAAFDEFTKLRTKTGGVYMSCLECKIAVDTLIIELKTNRSIVTIADDLRNGVCPKLPTDFFDGCEDFLKLYATTVVSMTVEQLDSQAICQGLKVCPAQSYAAVMAISTAQKSIVTCESCRGVTEFIKYTFANPEFKEQLENGIAYYLCQNLPESAVNICENLAQSYVPLFLQRVLMYLGSKDICKDSLHMC